MVAFYRQMIDIFVVGVLERLFDMWGILRKLADGQTQ